MKDTRTVKWICIEYGEEWVGEVSWKPGIRAEANRYGWRVFVLDVLARDQILQDEHLRRAIRRSGQDMSMLDLAKEQATAFVMRLVRLAEESEKDEV